MNERINKSNVTKTVIEQSGTAKWIRILGVIIIVAGFIAGLVLGKLEGGAYEEFNVMYFFICVIIGTIEGSIFIALGEIIKELHTIVQIAKAAKES